MIRRGYTLLEVALASAILAIVLLGAQSAVVIASRALPDSRRGPGAILAADAALGRLTDDLAGATGIVGMSATSLEFTTPDITGDSLPENILYSWSGVAGEPLTRTINGGKAVPVASGVEEFALTYQTALKAQPTTFSDSAESMLFSFTPTGATANGAVTSSKWWAQYFTPSLPAGAVSWSVTRVVIQAVRKSGNTGQAKGELRPDAAGSPASHVLAEAKILESALGSSLGDATVAYTFARGLSPLQGLWFVLEWVSDTEAFEFQYQTKAGVGAGLPLATSGNNGGSWSTVANSQMSISVFGTVRAPDAPKSAPVLQLVTCRVRTAPDPADGVTRAIRTPTEPLTP